MLAGDREGEGCRYDKGGRDGLPIEVNEHLWFPLYKWRLGVERVPRGPSTSLDPSPLHCSHPQQPQHEFSPWHQPASLRGRKAPPGSALTGLFRIHHCPKTHRPCKVLVSSPPLAAQSTRRLWPQRFSLMLWICPNRSPTVSINRTYCGLSAPHLPEQV